MRRDPRQRRLWQWPVVGLGILASFSFSAANAAKPRQDRHLFCVKTVEEDWTLQRYPPLLDLRAEMTVEQVGYDGARIDQVLLKRYYTSTQLTFEYKFDEAGKLVGLKGFLRRWGRWVAEADLYSFAVGGGDRSVRVRYAAAAGGETISAPEDAADYEPMLRAVEVYGTVNKIPCAGMLEEAEKMNATQE